MAVGEPVPETPEELYARAAGALRMPPVEEWETFPFDGDLRPRALLPPVEREKPRHGEGGVDCRHAPSPTTTSSGRTSTGASARRAAVRAPRRRPALPARALRPRHAPARARRRARPADPARRGGRARRRRDRPRPRRAAGATAASTCTGGSWRRPARIPQLSGASPRSGTTSSRRCPRTSGARTSASSPGSCSADDPAAHAHRRRPGADRRSRASSPRSSDAARAARSSSRSTTSGSPASSATRSATRSSGPPPAASSVRLAYNVDHGAPIAVPPPPRTKPELIESLPLPTKAIPGVPDLMHHKYVVRDGDERLDGLHELDEDSWQPRGERHRHRRLARGRRRVPARTSSSSGRRPTSRRPATCRPNPVRVDGTRVRAWFSPGYGAALAHKLVARDRPREAARADRLAGDHVRPDPRHARRGRRRRARSTSPASSTRRRSTRCSASGSANGHAELEDPGARSAR